MLHNTQTYNQWRGSGPIDTFSVIEHELLNKMDFQDIYSRRHNYWQNVYVTKL